jgi:hypothetical protein
MVLNPTASVSKDIEAVRDRQLRRKERINVSRDVTIAHTLLWQQQNAGMEIYNGMIVCQTQKRTMKAKIVPVE